MRLARSRLLAPALLLLAAAPPSPRLLGFDHMPTAVGDLDTGSARFRALGFTLKPGRYHANGIRNAHAKFADGSYIELITAPVASDDLTTRYRRHLEVGDGPAFLSLYVDRLKGLFALLAALGAVERGWTVSFAPGPLSHLFFGTRDRSPTDTPEHYLHANGARSLARVWLAPDDPRPLHTMLRRFGARPKSARLCLPRCVSSATVRLPDGEILLLPRVAQLHPGRSIVGATVTVGDLASVRRALRAGGIDPAASGIVERGGGIFIPPALANGMWLEFRPG